MTKRVKNNRNKNFEIEDAADATPLNPKNPAMIETTKNISAKYSISKP